MSKAILIGVGKYDRMTEDYQLAAPPNDVREMCKMVEAHDAAVEGGAGGLANFDCSRGTYTTDKTTIDTAFFDARVKELLAYDGDVLLFFAGHGVVRNGDLHLLTQEATSDDGGISTNKLLELANDSDAKSVTMILDCCHSGHAGPGNEPSKAAKPKSTLKEGRTILAAAHSGEQSFEEGPHGIFTSLLLTGLGGGAADPRGYITASALHSYAAFALSAWDQKPIYKAHVKVPTLLRRSKPRVKDEVILRLEKLFADGESHKLDPSYEWDDAAKKEEVRLAFPAKTENVARFNDFKALRNAGLLRCANKPGTDIEWDMYFIAMNHQYVYLTALGQRFWYLVKSKKFR